eukprot:319054-Rhodomonas_salina.1
MAPNEGGDSRDGMRQVLAFLQEGMDGASMNKSGGEREAEATDLLVSSQIREKERLCMFRMMPTLTAVLQLDADHDAVGRAKMIAERLQHREGMATGEEDVLLLRCLCRLAPTIALRSQGRLTQGALTAALQGRDEANDSRAERLGWKTVGKGRTRGGHVTLKALAGDAAADEPAVLLDA